jgi:hypothetical protein
LACARRPRLCEEIDAAQDRGEVATDATGGGRPAKTCPGSGQVPKPATFDDLDLDRRRVHEWRQLRAAGGEAR